MKDFPYSPEQLAWLNYLETADAAQGKGYLHKDDAFRYSFREIAEFIEADPKQVFTNLGGETT